MCGIVYSRNFVGKDSTKTVLKRFEAQRTRGTTSFGFYLPKQNKMCHNVKEGRIKSLLKRSKGDNSEILFHHRFSTSTPDVRNACHPFSTKQTFENEYIGVHNGVIYNTAELKAQHTPLGITYVSTQPDGRFNDSEALVYDLARYFEGEVTTITAKGSCAFIVIKRNKYGKPVTLFFGRNSGNPLKMKMTGNSLTLSSQGEGDDVEVNNLYSYDYDTNTISKRPMFIQTSSWGSSAHYNKGYQPKEYYPKDQSSAAWGYGSRNSWSKQETDDEFDDYHRQIPAHTNTASEHKLPKINIREGSYESVKNQFLEINQGDYEKATIQLIGEIEEGYEVIKKAEEVLDGIPVDSDEMERCIESFDELEGYVRMLEHITLEFEDKMDNGESITKRDNVDNDSDDPETIRRQVALALMN